MIKVGNMSLGIYTLKTIRCLVVKTKILKLFNFNQLISTQNCLSMICPLKVHRACLGNSALGILHCPESPDYLLCTSLVKPTLFVSQEKVELFAIINSISFALGQQGNINL